MSPKIELDDWTCLSCGGQMRPVQDPRLGDAAACSDCGMVEPL